MPGDRIERCVTLVIHAIGRRAVRAGVTESAEWEMKMGQSRPFSPRMTAFLAALSCGPFERGRMTASERVLAVIGISTALGLTLAAQTIPHPLFIYAHDVDRARYLANAVIWRDPGPLTPDDI